MLDIIALLLASGAARGINTYAAAQKKHDKSTVVCDACHAEAPIGSKFCPACRHTSLTRKKEFKKEELKNKIAQAKIDRQQAELNKRIAKAKEYYEYARTMRLCRACNTAFGSEAQYCANCGGATDGVSSDIVLTWMIAEFPDIVANTKDIDMLKNFSAESKITIGKVILGASKQALKGTLWAGKQVGDSLLNELNKK